MNLGAQVPSSGNSGVTNTMLQPAPVSSASNAANPTTLQLSGAPVNFQLAPVQLENGMTVIPIMHSSVPNVTLATINMSSLVTQSMAMPVISQGIVSGGGGPGGYIVHNSVQSAPSNNTNMRLVNIQQNLPQGGEVMVKEEDTSEEEEIQQNATLRNIDPSLSIHKVIRPNSSFFATPTKPNEQRSNKKPSVPVTCDQCQYSCSRQDRLNEHKRVVHMGVRYNCTECDFQTPRKDKLSNHKMVVHQGLRFNCEVCDFSAVRKDKLTHHMNAVHLGVRYPCVLCGFSTPRKDRLKQHVQSIHDRVRYPCPICDHQAVRKDKLRDHMLVVHHGFTYKCDMCTTEFTRPDKLKAHKRSQHLIQSPVVNIPNPFLNIPIVTISNATPASTTVTQQQNNNTTPLQHLTTAALQQQISSVRTVQHQPPNSMTSPLAVQIAQQQLSRLTGGTTVTNSLHQSTASVPHNSAVVAAQQQAMQHQLQQQLQQQRHQQQQLQQGSVGGAGVNMGGALNGAGASQHHTISPQVQISLVSGGATVPTNSSAHLVQTNSLKT